MSVVQVIPVEGRRGRAFHQVPAQVYGAAGLPWTPPLVSEERRLFDRSRNPSLEGTEYARWVALRGARPVGRVAAFAPRSPDDVGYFGVFECIDDEPTACALLSAAESWLASLGRRRCLGPLVINPRDQIGLLTDGFDRPATLLTPYNPPYYAGLLERAGYRVAVRLRAYAWEPAMPDPRGMLALDARLRAASPIHIRPIDANRLEAEALAIADVINRSFGATWRWTPITRAEAVRLATDLRPIIDPRLCLVAEDARGACGVALTVPDANWLLRRIGGRLWPLGWLTAARLRRRIPWARFMALAVLPGRRASGTALRLLVATHRALVAGGFEYAEGSQVFDDNALMRRLLERMGCAVVKRYAVFERDLTVGVTGC